MITPPLYNILDSPLVLDAPTSRDSVTTTAVGGGFVPTPQGTSPPWEGTSLSVLSAIFVRLAY